MVNKSIIYDEMEPEYFEVEKGAIRKFATAIGDENPVYFDEEYAKKKRLPSLLAPLTFPATFRGVIPEWFRQIDRNKLLHGEQEYQYNRRFYAGEKIKLIEKVIDVYEKEGKNGLMTFVVRLREGFDQENIKIFSEKTTFIIRGE